MLAMSVNMALLLVMTFTVYGSVMINNLVLMLAIIFRYGCCFSSDAEHVSHWFKQKQLSAHQQNADGYDDCLVAKLCVLLCVFFG